MPVVTTLSNQMQDADRGMQQAFARLNAGCASLLQAFAKSHQDQAARLQAAADALTKAAGASDPRVVALEAQRDRRLQFAAGIQTALQRAQALPQPGAGQQSFTGQVKTPDGALAQGVTVRLASTMNNVTTKIGATTSNQFGDFALNIPVCELTVPADATPDYQLVAEDASGRTVASAPVTVDTSTGLIAFVPLTISPPAAAAPTPKPKPAAKPPAKPARGSPKDHDDKD